MLETSSLNPMLFRMDLGNEQPQPNAFFVCISETSSLSPMLFRMDLGNEQPQPNALSYGALGYSGTRCESRRSTAKQPGGTDHRRLYG